ncbi:MAG TPA: matrixin family metalloprotease [Polyangia bacterium]
MLIKAIPTGAKLLILFAAPAVLVACVEPADEGGPSVVFDVCRPTVLQVPADATADERLGVEGAIALWNQVSGPQLTLSDRPATDPPALDPTRPLAPPVDEQDRQRLSIGFRAAAPLFFGLYRPDVGDILINRGIQSQRAREIIIAHEIGHAFGLPHIIDQQSLMNPGNTQVPPAPQETALLQRQQGPCTGTPPVP